VRANDILLLHENLTRPSLLPTWSKEVDRILGGIRAKGLEVLPLAELIGRPVMAAPVARDGIRRTVNSDLPDPAAPDVHELRPPNPDEH
jgi:hypothetical protein